MTSNVRVLVVEDNRSSQKVYKAMLESRGIAIDIVENGMEGIRAVARGDYDVVLMDIQMPGMDGMEATQRIRALSDPKGKIPVIAVTANAMVGDREKYLAAGLDDYVSKPISSDTLMEAIQRWCANDAANGNASAGSSG